MSPIPILNRRLVWDPPQPPRTGKPKGIDPAFILRQPPMKLPLWRSLHDQLIRQPYIITLLYGTTQDQFGRSDTSEETTGEMKP